MLTLQETQCVHDFMNRPNLIIDFFFTYIYILVYHQSIINLQCSTKLADFLGILN